ncbi:MAG: hypothetical protein QW611_05520 [Ignisphaera sp.]
MIAHDYNEVIKYNKFVTDLDVNFDNCICKDNSVVDCIALCKSDSGEKHVVGIDITSDLPKCEEIKNKRIGCLSQDLINNSKIVFLVIATKNIPVFGKWFEECPITIITKSVVNINNIHEELCKVPSSAILYLRADELEIR